MSEVSPDGNIRPCKYAGIGSAMAEGLERMLKGEKAEIGGGTLAGALKLLNLANDSFADEGYLRKPMQKNVPFETPLSARIFITEVYERATGTEFLDMPSQEATIRELVYLTKSLQNLCFAARLPPEPVEGYKRLQQFWQAVKEIGNRDREVRALCDRDYVYTPPKNFQIIFPL